MDMNEFENYIEDNEIKAIYRRIGEARKAIVSNLLFSEKAFLLTIQPDKNGVLVFGDTTGGVALDMLLIALPATLERAAKEEEKNDLEVAPIVVYNVMQRIYQQLVEKGYYQSDGFRSFVADMVTEINEIEQEDWDAK